MLLTCRSGYPPCNLARLTVFLKSISFLGRYLLQHEEEGGLVDREDAPEGLHRLRHARRHGPEGKLVEK